MTQATAKIVLDSISPDGIRLTTFAVRNWRPIHSETMTHRVFSRNAGSSRARPSQKIIDQVLMDPWGPIHWGKNQPGMQANEEFTGTELAKVKAMWHDAARSAAHHAQIMTDFGVHKQIVNRVIEPYTYIDVLITATDFANWFALRDHADAQPEIKELAQLMKNEYFFNSVPKQIHEGEWHLPYITEDDWINAHAYAKENRTTLVEPGYRDKLEIVRKISVARCARVSYRAFDGTMAPIEKDLELFEQLLVSQPLHASPAEHQATPDMEVDVVVDGHPTIRYLHQHQHGNFKGWRQFRKMLPNEYVAG